MRLSWRSSLGHSVRYLSPSLCAYVSVCPSVCLSSLVPLSESTLHHSYCLSLGCCSARWSNNAARKTKSFDATWLGGAFCGDRLQKRRFRTWAPMGRETTTATTMMTRTAKQFQVRREKGGSGANSPAARHLRRRGGMKHVEF